MEKSNQRRTILRYVFISIIFSFLVIVAAFIKRTENRKNYRIASDYITKENYESAIELFAKINTYKDSAEKVTESKYGLALEYYKNEDFENAKKIFIELGDYLDSELYVAKIDVELTERSKELSYNSAYSYYQNKEYEKALDIYETISDYKMSNIFISHCKKNIKRLQNSHVLAAGIRNSVIINNSGGIKTAGLNGFHQLDVDSWKNIISIDICGTLTIGLQENGVAKIAGTYDKKEILDLDDWNDLIDIAAGEQFVVGLKSDGTVIAGGLNGDGETEVKDWTNVIDIDAGSRFTVGLTEDKELLFTGFCDNQVEDFEKNKDEWKEVISISASGSEKDGIGGGHTVGLKSNHTLVAVGDNTYGQCDFSDTKKWSDIVKVATGDWYTVGLKSDGTVVMTGENFPEYKYINEEVLNKCDNIIDIAAGYGQTILLTEDGEIICFGLNDDGKRDDINGYKDAMIPQY